MPSRFGPLALTAVMALAGCDKEAKTARPAPVPTRESPSAQAPLVGSEGVRGLKALHDTVYARAARGDTLGLLRLFVRDSVYRALVWPTQPSYEPDRDQVWMLVSGMNKANSNKGLRRLLGDTRQSGGTGSSRPSLPRFKRKDLSGGILFSREKRDLAPGELSLFAAALCRDDFCQVLTYANAGLVGGRVSGQE